MADYWVSQARKYCDFCKCWIADNKPSVQFHENGKRHKAAVEAKIKEIGKKSVADKRAKEKMDDDIKKMEEAAMKAYMKDIQENPDFSSQSALEEARKQNIFLPKVVAEERRKSQWHEAKTDKGDVYYWHSVSGETRWDVPREGFISMKDQSIQRTATAKNIPKAPKRKHHKGDKHKKKTKKDEGPKMENSAPTFETFGPLPSGNPYGHWETVENSVPEEIDLQLPEKTNQPPKLAQPIVEDEPALEFKEKSVSSVEDFGSGSSSGTSFQFKKRKLNRGNTRQTTADY